MKILVVIDTGAVIETQEDTARDKTMIENGVAANFLKENLAVHQSDTYEHGMIWTGASFGFPVDVIVTQKKEEIKAKLVKETHNFVCSNGIDMDATSDAVRRLDDGVKLAEAMNEVTMDVRDFSNVVHVGLNTLDVAGMVKEMGQNYRTQLNRKWTVETKIETILLESITDAKKITKIKALNF